MTILTARGQPVSQDLSQYDFQTYVHSQDGVIDAKAFRNTLGRFASGVTVITTVHETAVHGMTASAFISVSLQPPLVAVSVGERAKLHSLLTLGSRYGVSILNAAQADASNHFAGFGPPNYEPTFVWVDGLPLLQGAVAHLLTTVVDVHPAGDHTLFIAHVDSLNWFEDAPLLYFRGGYGGFEKNE
jgi:flavin reductase (DIM6/NTAB) family NADH-FMN oxidoreductase RutF